MRHVQLESVELLYYHLSARETSRCRAAQQILHIRCGSVGGMTHLAALAA